MEPIELPELETDQFLAVLRPGTRTPEHPTRSDIRLLSPDFYDRPFERFAWMRDNAPVYWDDEAGIWGLASHEHVSHVSRSWETFCSGEGSRPESSVPSMINMDPPEHTFRRRLVNAGFTPRRVQDHEPYLRAKVTQLIDAVADRGECDFVRDIATPLPMFMIGELMGLPEADHAQLLHWSDLFATGGEEVGPQVEQAVGDYAAYILDFARDRRANPTDDLLGIVANADQDGKALSDWDFVFETMLILVGGDETTRHVITGGLAALLQHPDQLQALRDDLSALPTAIEEMLRWVSPIKNMNRTATRDVELGGQQIRAGERMLLLYPSANRDARVFDDPDRFDITRSPNEHVAFGAYGRHHCLGAQLARLELRVLFEELLTRLPEISFAEDGQALPERRGNFVLGIETMPIRFSTGAPSPVAG